MDWQTTFWPISWELEFYQLWDWWWNINNNIILQFRLFPGKTKDIIFQKTQKNPILEPFLALFGQIWARMNFRGKKDCQFLNILIIYNRARIRKIVKLQGKTCNFSKSNTPQWVFCTLFRLYKSSSITKEMMNFLNL